MKFKNYLSVTLLLLGVSLFTTNGLFAQYEKKDTFIETTGVSNQGVVSGYEDWAGPYFLWSVENNTTELIGGAAPGNGIGGKAHFSNDGNLISGSMYVSIPVTPEWERTILSDYSYIFKELDFPEDGFGFGYTVGQTLTYNGDGIVLRTTDYGTSWIPMWIDEDNRALESLSFPETFIGYVAGWNAYFAKTTNGGWDWEELEPADPADVWYYSAVRFKDTNNGVVGASLEVGGGAIYTTSDGGLTWNQATGVEVVPRKIVHASGNTYFMVGGDKVQKSTDNGSTWTTVYTIPSALLLGINFYDEMLGIVTGETYIHKTTDGGVTWQELAIAPGITEGVLWRDVAWVENSNNVVLTGTPDVIFESTDGGSNGTGWTWANQDIFNGDPALYSIAISGDNIIICGSQGNFYHKSLLTTSTHSEMGMYSVSDGDWTPLGDLGYQIDISTSSGYSISADGSTVVGNSWMPGAYTHAVAWNQNDGIIDLGTLHSGKSTRADGVSSDGSVIVGWQDFNGPWKAAVWRKDTNGNYLPNEYLLIDPNGDPNDEFNQLGQASAVSANGEWIGGYGDYAHPNPWIWSEATGLIDLGDLGIEEENTIGRVTAINHDGSIVIGWYQSGGGPWDPPVYTPFIWTPDLGTQDLNQFIIEELEYDMGGDHIFVPNGMSANGHYITGFAFNENPQPWGDFFTFRLQITDWLLNTTQFENVTMNLYPNPVVTNLTIDAHSTIDNVYVYNTLGQLIIEKKVNQNNFQLDMSNLEKGVYFVKVQIENSFKTHKIIKK